MPDSRRHRGPHPEDGALFAPEHHAALRAAVADLSWLLSRDYAPNGAIKLVGDRYRLSARQRNAVQRGACSDSALASRMSRRCDADAMPGRPLLLDAYNVLTTLEVALSGGFVFIARDHCCRDLASIHGTWRRVVETRPALELIAHAAVELRLSQLIWYLDAPVSNSARLKATLLDLASAQPLPWQVELVPNPDAVLSQSPHTIASADSVILDRCQHWFNLTRHILAPMPSVHWVDLSGPTTPPG